MFLKIKIELIKDIDKNGMLDKRLDKVHIIHVAYNAAIKAKY